MTETEIKTKLIKKAIEKHGSIAPCGFEHTLLDCFTQEDGKWMLWYNVGEDTRVVRE